MDDTSDSEVPLQKFGDELYGQTRVFSPEEIANIDRLTLGIIQTIVNRDDMVKKLRRAIRYLPWARFVTEFYERALNQYIEQLEPTNRFLILDSSRTYYDFKEALKANLFTMEFFRRAVNISKKEKQQIEKILSKSNVTIANNKFKLKRPVDDETTVLLIVLSHESNQDKVWPTGFYKRERKFRLQQLRRITQSLQEDLFPGSKSQAKKENEHLVNKNNGSNVQTTQNDPIGSEENDENIPKYDENIPASAPVNKGSSGGLKRKKDEKNSHSSTSHSTKLAKACNLSRECDVSMNKNTSQLIPNEIATSYSAFGKDTHVKHNKRVVLADKTTVVTTNVVALKWSFMQLIYFKEIDKPDHLVAIIGLEDPFETILLMMGVRCEAFKNLKSVVLLLPTYFTAAQGTSSDEGYHERLVTSLTDKGLEDWTVSIENVSYPGESKDSRQVAILLRNDYIPVVNELYKSHTTAVIDAVFKVLNTNQATSVGGSHATSKKSMTSFINKVGYQKSDCVWEIGMGVGQFACVLSALTTKVIATETDVAVFSQFKLITENTRSDEAALDDGDEEVLNVGTRNRKRLKLDDSDCDL